MNFVVCVATGPLGDFSGEDLTVGRLYEVVAEADPHGMIRVIDDSGEDYLYPATLFDPVEVRAETAERLHQALAAA